ncbi:DNA polymerase III subunit beta [bacterium]|nr:DNA polymerase III subunit beta [bacterium]|tara:strand:- start:5820 stop:6914 length:1095 start_codon:yes stop_codon:yes gene_type:complete
MHVTVATETLQQKLELVARVSTKHVTLPVLQCVLLEVNKKEITIKATNLEIGIEATISGSIEEEGVVAVPAVTLIQTINLHTQKEVTLRVEEGSLVVEGKESTTQIKTIPHDEFPTIPRLTTDPQVVNGAQFALGIKTVVFAASQSSIKPELGSVYIFQKKEHSLTFVATDSFRLMEKTVTQPNVALDDSLLIPQKNALEIMRMLESVSEDPKLQVDENQCAFMFGDDLYITSRLTSGSFPDYNQIIPKEYVTHSTVLRKDLIHAFKKSNIFLNKFMQVGLIVTSDALTVSATSGEVGATTESIAASTKGEDITLNFNQRYVAESLNHFVDDSVVLHFAGIGRPMVIEGVNDTSTRYLVMPMNK